MAIRQRTRPDPFAEALRHVEREQRRRAEERAHREVALRGEEIREQCSTLPGFIRWAWPILEPGTLYSHNWHIDAISEHLTAIVRGDLQNLAINLPPAHMKSLLVSVFFPSWWWSLDATKRFLSASYEQTLALRDNEKMRALITSPEYQAMWGEHTRLTKTGTSSFLNVSRGAREARAFKSMTGGRGDVVLIDDPHSTVTAESDVERAKVVRVFTEGIQNRVNDLATSSIIVIMQRLHSNDVSGTIDTLGLNYERLILPMEYEVDRVYPVKKIPFTDPRTKEGELLHPEKFPPGKVAELKKGGSYFWAGQYQQRPVPREGGLFKREWFDGKIIDAEPAGIVWWRHWDLAATELKPGATAGARTCGVKLGRAADGSFIVAHMIATASSGKKVRNIVKAQAEVDGYGVKISVPQDPGAAGKTVALDYIDMLAAYDCRKLRETEDKVTRAEPVSAQAEAGNLYLLRGAWNQEFLDELCLFPGGPRKDVADALSGAYAQIIGRGDLRAGQGIAGPMIIDPNAPDAEEARDD